MNELCHLPAHELVSLMSSGAVSCKEVMQAHLARIEAVNPMLNALVEAADPEQCLQLADHADACAARGDLLGKAHGLPVVIKDVMRVAGLACSGGSRVLRACTVVPEHSPRACTAPFGILACTTVPVR
jgi:amidase